MSKITCALSGSQIESLFKLTYKAMKNALEAGEAFNADLFMSDLFDKIATKKDLATAILFIQQAPSLMYTAAGQSNLLALEYSGDINDGNLRKLMREYKDPTNGFNLVLGKYAPEASPEDVLQATVIQNSLIGKPTLDAKGNPPTGSAEVERMKPYTTLTSTFMEFVKLDPNATEVLTKEKIDPNRMRIYNTIEKIRDSIPVDITPFTEVIYKGKVIKLKAIKLTKLDQNMLDQTTRDEIIRSRSIKPKDSEADVFYKGEMVVQADDRVALVICNEKGDFIYFDDDGNISSKEEGGKLVYQFTRNIRVDTADPSQLRSTDIYGQRDQIMTPDELFAAEARHMGLSESKYTKVLEAAGKSRSGRIAEITEEQQREFKELKVFNDTVIKDGKTHLLPLTGISLGVPPNLVVQGPMTKQLLDAELITRENFKSIVPIKESRDGFEEGTNVIRINGEEFALDRPGMPQEIAEKIAHMLTNPKISVSDKLLYMSYFMNNEISNGAKRYVIYNDPIKKEFGFKLRKYTQYEAILNKVQNNNPAIDVPLIPENYQKIVDGLMEGYYYKGEYFASKMPFNEQAIHDDIYYDYNTETGTFDTEPSSYVNFLMSLPDIKVTLVENKDPGFFNSYMHFSIDTKFTEEVNKAASDAKKNPTIAEKKAAIVEVLKKKPGTTIKGNVAKLINAAGYKTETQWVFTDKNGSTVNFYNHEGNITEADLNAEARLVLLEPITGKDGTVYPDPVGVFIGDKRIGYVQENSYSLGDAVINAEATSETPITNREAKENEILQRATDLSITQEQINDLLAYDSGTGTILEQATRLIDNYNRIFDVQAKVIDFKGSRLYIKIGNFETSIDAEAVKLGGKQLVFSIDQTGISELINAKFSAELDALEETEEEADVVVSSLNFGVVEDVVEASDEEMLNPEGVSQPSDTGEDIPDFGFDRSADLPNGVTQEQIDAAKEWWYSSPLSKFISIEHMANIVNSNVFARFIASGKTLATPFNLGKIQINEATKGNYVDVYHEAWHVFSQLFLTKNQKLELYNEVRNSNPKWKNLSFLQIEEMIAEDFRSYALDPKPVDAMPKRNTIFRRILNFLRKLFGKKTNINSTSEVEGVKNLFDKLYFSHKNPELLKDYKPLTDNVMWDILNRGPQAVNDKDAEFLSSQDGKLVAASIDSIFSTLIDRAAKTGGKGVSMAVLSDAFLTKDGITNKAASYVYAKNKLIARLNADRAEALAIGLPKSLQQQNRLELLNDNIRILTATLDNWGNDKTGMVKYHMDNSTFDILNQKVVIEEEDPANDDKSAPEDAGKTEKFEKTAGEKSLTEMASADTLFILKSIFKVDSKGNKVQNRFGFDELADFPSVWNNVVRAVGSEKDPAVMQQKLEQAAITFPELRQLVESKLPDLANPKSPLEMKITTAFWQDFRKSRISYIQLFFAKDKNSPGYISEVIEASNETTSVIYKFRNKFKARLEDEFTAKTPKNTSLLKLDAIVKEFGVKGSFKSSESFRFARALGISLDDLIVIKRELENNPEYYGLQYLYSVVKKFNEIENDPKASREAIKYLKMFKEDPIDTLTKDIPAGVLGKKIVNEKNLIVKLAELQGRYGKDSSNFSVLNAERNLVFEHIEDFSASLQVTAINDVDNLSKLWTTNKYQFMSYLDPSKNSFTKRSKILDSIFKVNAAEDIYERRNNRTLTLNVVSGTQVDDKVTGANTTSLDKQGKFIQEMHMMLKSGLQEFMRHASKSSSFGARVEGGLVIGRGKGEDDHLYVDIDKFATANEAELFAIENIFTGYIASELERIIRFKSNIDEYRNFAGYNRVIKDKDGKEIGLAGEFFTAFDNVLRDQTKKDLINNIDQMDTRNPKFLENFLSKNPSIKEAIVQDITDYFNEQTDENNEFLNSKPYVEDALMNRLSMFNMSAEDTQRALVKAYTYNSWIHNFEMANLFYGDITQFNHSKDDGHKRIPGATSGGNGFRTDIGAQNYIKDVLNAPKRDPKTGELVPNTYAAVLNKKYNVDRYRDINYNGTFNTAILQDIERKSVYSPIIEKALREDYKTRFKNADKAAMLEQFNKDERKSLQNSTLDQLKEKLIDKRIKSEMKAYNKMEEGDGQGYVTIDAYRALKVLEGAWLPEQETLYQKIIAGKEITPQEVIKFLPPYKVQNFGPLANAPITVTAMHKFSLMPLIPTMIKGSDLESMHEQMLANDIQYVTFQTGSKVGSITSQKNKDGKPVADKIYSDSDQKSIIKPDPSGKGGIQFTKNTIYLEYLKNVTNVPEKRKKQTIFSTQLRKLILEGLYDRGLISESKFNPYVQAYENAVKDYSRVLRLEILNEIGYERKKNGKYEGKLDKFLELVQRELGRKEVPEHLIEYIGVTPQGKIINDLSYHLEADDIEKILVSLINKRLTKQKVKGEALVQVASSMTNGMWSPSPNMTKATEDEIRKYMGTNNLPFYNNEGGGVNFDKLYKNVSKDELKKILAAKEKTLAEQARYWSPTPKYNLTVEIQYLKDVIAGKKPSITEVANPTAAMKVAVAMQGDFTNIFNAKDLDGNTIGVFDIETVVGKDGKERQVKKLRFQESLDRLNALIKNDEWLNKDNNRKLITMTAVRIPVQGLNSMEFMEVFHFLPPEAGNIIIPPTELVAKSGADYDIDKLTTFMPSIDSDGKFIESLMTVDEVERLVKNQAQDSAQAARIIATQKSAIENRLIQSTKDILALSENFANLVRPNDTYLLKDIADELEELVTDYDKYHTAHEEGPRYDGDKKVISPTKMLEVGFNVHKQDVNMGGKDGLGIVALKNALHPVFVAIGAKMPKTYKASEWDKKLERYVETDVDHDMRLLMRHNTINGNISLSDVYDVDKIDRISDLFNHMMNGLVDVEKDSWIFNIQGNVEVIPVLSYLLMAGVPRQLAVKFVSQPLVRQYVERQKILNSPYSKITGDTPEFSVKSEALSNMGPMLPAAVSNKANIYKLIDTIKSVEGPNFVITTKANPEKNIQAESIQLSKQDLIKRLEHKDSNFRNIAKIIVVGGKKNLASSIDKSPFSATNYYYTAKAASEVAGIDNFNLDQLDTIVETSDTTSPEALAAFAHFIEIERQISGLEALQRVANPDTKTFKTIEEIIQREHNLMLVSEMSKLDPDLVKNLMNESILSEFYDNELVKQLLEPLFILRNNRKVSAFITKALEQGRGLITAKYGTGEDATRMFINQFKNAIVNYAYQNYMTNSIDMNGNLVDYPEMYNDLEVVMGKNIPNGAKIVGDKIYLDMEVLNLDFSEKRYMNSSADPNNYNKRGLRGFPGTDEFFQTKASFIKYVMEREYQRRSNPVESISTNKDFVLMKKLLKNVIADDKLATERAYEAYLNQQALFNTFNRRALMIIEDFSFTDHFFNVINDEAYTFLKDKYPVLNQFTEPKISTKEKVITINNKNIIKGDVAEGYYQNLVDLADPNVKKVTDTVDNKRLSDLFKLLPLVALYTHGIGYSKEGMNKILPYENFMDKIFDASRIFAANNLNEDTFMDIFNKLVTNNRSTFKDYVTPITETPESEEVPIEPPVEVRSTDTGGLEFGAPKVAAEPKTITTPVMVISPNSKGLGAGLSIQTVLARSKGNIVSEYPVTFQGTQYLDADQALQLNYKKYKVEGTGPMTVYSLMVDILTERFKQHPKLVNAITQQGGSKLLLNAIFQPTQRNDMWETGGKNYMVLALNEAYLNIVNPEAVVTPTENPVVNEELSQFVNHSGGAYGGDTFWDIIGRLFGVTQHKHYREAGNVNLSQKLRNAKVTATVLTKAQMDIARAEVQRILGKSYPDTLEGNLQVRNYYQVSNADSVLAVATLTADKTGVTGGTNTAVQLGIALEKPTYVWDTNTEKWYKFNGTTFVETVTPTLTKNFAGVGTRDIENYNTLNRSTNKFEPRKQYLGAAKEAAAKEAIRQVYEKTAQQLQGAVPVQTTPQASRFKGSMSYAYGSDKRPEVQATTTFDAILNGERTATTRYEANDNIDYWRKAKVGDIITWESADGRTVDVVVTKIATKLKDSGITPEQWSKLEGWTVDYFERKVRPKIDTAWIIEYKLATPVAQPSTSKSEGYNFNPSNVSETTRKEYKQYVLNQLGTPKVEYQKDSVKFTYPDFTITIGKDGALSYSKVSQKIVDLSVSDPGYDIKFMVGLNKYAEEQLNNPQPQSQPAADSALTQEEADWLFNNLKLITKTYNSSTLDNSKDIELKKPLTIGDTKVTHIDPVPGDTPSIIFERPSGRWMIKIEERNGKMHPMLYQWKDIYGKGDFSFYTTDDSTGNDLDNIKKSGLTDLVNQLYNDTNIPNPGTRLGQFQASNALQQKYGLKRTYKDIVNALMYAQPAQAAQPENIDNVQSVSSLGEIGTATFTVGDDLYMINPKKDAEKNAYFKLYRFDKNANVFKGVTNAKTKQSLSRKDTEEFISQHLPKDFTDFLLDVYTTAPLEISSKATKNVGTVPARLIDEYLWQMPLREYDYSSNTLPILLTVEEVNEAFEKGYSEKLKTGIKKYMLPFAKQELSKEYTNQKKKFEDVIKNGNPATIQNTKVIINDLEAALAKFSETAQPVAAGSPVSIQPTQQSIEISSNAKGLAAALTNPTELAKSKGNLTESYPVEFKGKIYKDAEEAYQALKSTATKDEGPNSTYNLMVEIIKAKLQQYPRLVNEITTQGGSTWILSATHQPTSKNTVWETGGKNWFIKALNEAYLSLQDVKTTVSVVPVNTEEGSILASRAVPLAYTSLQVKALNEVGALIDRRRDGFYLLAGYAGTGKTTIAENIARYARSKGYGVEVIAPTNKAAKVLAGKLKEAGIGNIKPNTIHGTIYMAPDEETKGWRKKPSVSRKVFIVDEASMIDDKLMADIISFVKDNNNIVVFMGDGFQLEQIGDDSGLFASLTKPEVFNKKYGVSLDGGIMLTEVRRQSLDSEILKLATIARIDDKIYVPARSTADFEMIDKPSDFQNLFLQAIKAEEDAVAIVATNNERIRLNDLARRVKFGRGSEPIMPGETIVAVANSAEYRNSEVFNIERVERMSDPFPVKFSFDKGNNTIEEKTYNVIMANVYDEQGKFRNMLMIPELDKPSLYHGQVMEAAKQNPQLMAFLKKEDLIYTDMKGKKSVERTLVIGTYGYAITGHKSQGSQWKKVFVNQNYVANNWNPARWYYTAITRSSDKVIVLANALQTPIASDKVTQKLSVEESKTKSSDFDYIAASDPDAGQLKAFYDTLTLLQKQKIGTLENLFKEYKETPFEYTMDEFIENIKTCKL